MKLLLFYLSIILAIGPCAKKSDQTVKTQEQTKEISKKDTLIKENKNEKIQTTQKVKGDTLRLVVSFYSRASGINRSAKEKYDTLISKFQNDNNLKLEYEKIKWGREGEVDYCFNLKVISKNIQEKFISETKLLLEGKEQVKIYENINCFNKQ